MKNIVAIIIVILIASAAQAQMRPQDLGRDFVVKLVMKDTTEFYGIVLQKPVPDRIIFQTRYGRLEIPLKDIDYAVDYRFNFVLKDELAESSSKNAIDVQKNNLSQYTNQQRAEYFSVIHTNTHDIFRGNRYLFDDSAHIVLSTDWGDLYFIYTNISYVDNYSGANDRRKDFFTTQYMNVKDPRSSQTFITPTSFAYGAGNNFLTDYLFGGLQINFGVTDWLSANLGGVFLPLKDNVIVGTGGIKVTPYESELWRVAFGGQGLYSQVTHTTRLGLAFAEATYGRWDANLTLLGGITWKNEETDTNRYTAQDFLIAVAGSERVGENLKANVELFFISNFEIVPVAASIRYFQEDLTIDVGVVFSLYKSGSIRTTKTLGEYVFGAADFPIIPVISGSYHF
ncbi:MAG TPA: hypothetical protein VFO76_08805 [Candidatus Kapabacteria bacterium]|nr:hypothetical protein [Candidatus Kapabacteria bacterium]